MSQTDPPDSAAEPEDASGRFAEAHDDFGLRPRARVRRVDPLIGADLGGITITRLVGEGGMGRVYEARQTIPARTVAVKVMRQGIASDMGTRRFEREADFLARLQHPGIAQIYLVGNYSSDEGDVPFFVMEYVAGATPINSFVAEKSLSLTERLQLFGAVCEAVSHGHDRGIIHRDLKPGNILIDSSGKPRVIDFGVARSTDSGLALTSLRTATGNFVGTAQYMSPEQFGAKPDDLDPRSDVYSLGVVLFELVSGTLPYDLQNKGLHEMARLVCERPPAPVRSHDKRIPRAVAAIVEKCLEKSRLARYQSAGELAQDIRRFLDGRTVQAGRGNLVSGRWLRRLMPTAKPGQALLLLLAGGLFTGLASMAAWQLSNAGSQLGLLPGQTFSMPAPPAKSAHSGPVTKAVFVTSAWQATGLTVEKGQCYQLTVTGQLRDKAGTEFGPDGTCPIAFRTVLGPPAGLPPVTRATGYVGQHPIRSFIARIGENSWSIDIGPGLTFIAPDSGQLSVRINEREDSPLSPEGTLTCTLTPVPEPKFVDSSGRTTVWAHIDNVDTLLVSPRGLQWEYGGKWSRVGQHEGVFPTLVNGIAWWPTWPDPVYSSRLETRDFHDVAVAIASGGRGVRVLDVTARHGRAEVLEPTDDVARIKFVDLAFGSGDIGCTFEIMPPETAQAPDSTL